MAKNNPPHANFEKVVASEHQSVLWKHAIRKQFRTPYHYHPECELIHIRQGYGRRWVGGSITHFGPGDLVFIAPNVPHTWQVAPKCPQAETFYIQFRPDFAGPDFFKLPEMQPVQELIDAARGGMTFSEPVRTEIGSRLEQIQHLNSTECLLGLLDILYRLSRDHGRRPLGIATSRTLTNRRQEGRINKVFEYINQHLNEPISQAEIAQRISLSPAAFSRLFKNTTGKCFMEVINELRIAQAVRLLDETDHTISEIAYECGFETLSHFNSKFRQITQTTPSRHRKNVATLQGQSWTSPPSPHVSAPGAS